MKRNVDLKDISDGKLYSANDMVRNENIFSDTV